MFLDVTQLATVAGTLVTMIGGILYIKDYSKKSREATILRNEQQKNEIISAMERNIEPLKVSLEKDKEQVYANLSVKEQNINDLWKDVESLEDHLNSLEKDVAKHSGVIDIQTPLIMEVKNQILSLKEKIDLLTKEQLR